jgi:hypothetical protein
MKLAKTNSEASSTTNLEQGSKAPNVVYQPPKLNEIVEIINVMGNVSTKVREDNAGDWTGAAAQTSGQTGQAGTSARDLAIKRAPSIPVMQQQLIKHLENEMKIIKKQAKAVSRSNARGSAYLLSELYKKLRRLSELISQIAHASADVIKRFYISVFIDKQPMVVKGGSIATAEE